MKKIFIIFILIIFNINKSFSGDNIEMLSEKGLREGIISIKQEIFEIEKNIKNFAPEILYQKKLEISILEKRLIDYEKALKIKIEENRKQNLRIFYFKIIFLSLVFSLIFGIGYFFYKNW